MNEVGDLVITDPQAMGALADPSRLALLDRLRRDGPATAGELSASIEASRSATEDHLQELEQFGLVTRSDAENGPWRAVAKGFVFEIPDDPEGQAAARQLTATMFLSYVDLPSRWIDDEEPRLDLDWARAAGLFNARVKVSPEELRRLQEGLERLVQPFITRESGEVPAEARPARILTYFMPEAAPDGPREPGS